MLADTSIRKVVIGSGARWVVLRVASRLQCSVASSCARPLGGGPAVPCWLLSDVAQPIDWAAAPAGGGGTGLLDTRASCSARTAESITRAIDPGYQRVVLQLLRPVGGACAVRQRFRPVDRR